jgi:hypothetical protein
VADPLTQTILSGAASSGTMLSLPDSTGYGELVGDWTLDTP